MDKFDYKTHSVLYKNNYIQTYEFGEGDNVVIAFPSYPHSGLYYLKLFMHNTKSDIRFIVFDLPGWAGYSDNIFKREDKRRQEKTREDKRRQEKTREEERLILMNT